MKTPITNEMFCGPIAYNELILDSNGCRISDKEVAKLNLPDGTTLAYFCDSCRNATSCVSCYNEKNCFCIGRGDYPTREEVNFEIEALHLTEKTTKEK